MYVLSNGCLAYHYLFRAPAMALVDLATHLPSRVQSWHAAMTKVVGTSSQHNFLVGMGRHDISRMMQGEQTQSNQPIVG